MSQNKTVGTVEPVGQSTRFLWKIENFCICNKNVGDRLISPVYSTMNSSTEHDWLLKIFPKGFNEEYKDYISLYLGYKGKSSVHVKVVFSMLDNNNCQVAEYKFQNLYTKISSVQGIPKFIKQDFVTNKKNRVLVNDTIIVLCEIIYDSKLAVPLKNKYEEENLLDYCRLKEFDEFEKLLEAENPTSDVTIKIGEDEIKAHKAIIMTRSPVFQAMFEHNMKEKEQSIVEITDITYRVMKEVVRFIYTGKVNEIDGIAGDLLIAAEKYSIKGLKVLSGRRLFENLAMSNAVEYLKLADIYNADNLKTKIIQFIISNQKDVIHQSEFQILPGKLIYEVLCAIFDKKE